MPTFLSTHRVPGLDEDTMAETTASILESTFARFKESYVDYFDGYLVTLWEGEDRTAVEKELQRLGFPFLELHQIHLHRSRSDLEAELDAAT